MKIRLLLQIIIISFLCAACFRQLYYGKNGIKAYLALSLEVEGAQADVQKLRQTLAEREAEVYAWKTDPFFKEKLAREDLLYSCTNEYVYIIPGAST